MSISTLNLTHNKKPTRRTPVSTSLLSLQNTTPLLSTLYSCSGTDLTFTQPKISSSLHTHSTTGLFVYHIINPSDPLRHDEDHLQVQGYYAKTGFSPPLPYSPLLAIIMPTSTLHRFGVLLSFV